MLIVFQVINQLTETLLPYYSNLQQSKQSQVGTATDGKEDEASVAAFAASLSSFVSLAHVGCKGGWGGRLEGRAWFAP